MFEFNKTRSLGHPVGAGILTLLFIILLQACRADFAWKNGRDPQTSDAITPQSIQPSFTITTSNQRPPVAGFQGSEVILTANCQNNGNIDVSWDFGNGLAERGLSIKKSFSNTGAVTIKATCIGNVTLNAQTTLDVYYPGATGNCQPGQAGCNGGYYPGPSQY